MSVPLRRTVLTRTMCIIRGGHVAGRGPNFRIVLFWVRDEREGPIAVKDRRLGTDRRRSRQRTVVVGDVSYATVYLVRHALAGIERAT